MSGNGSTEGMASGMPVRGIAQFTGMPKQKKAVKKYPSKFSTGTKNPAAQTAKAAGLALGKKPKGKNPFYHKEY